MPAWRKIMFTVTPAFSTPPARKTGNINAAGIAKRSGGEHSAGFRPCGSALAV